MVIGIGSDQSDGDGGGDGDGDCTARTSSTTWVGSLTTLVWFTKSISNKYQSREIVKLKVGDVISSNNQSDGITTINTSYDKDNFILCVPTYSTELGSTQPHGTKETQFHTKKYGNMPQINRN